jgi:phosphatidate cytidylyltransferase
MERQIATHGEHDGSSHRRPLPWRWPERFGPDLLPRIGSGLVMAVAALLLAWRGGLGFFAMVLGGGLVMCWEWGRLVRGDGLDRLALAHMGALVVAASLAALGLHAPALIALAVLAIVLLVVDRPRPLTAAGVLYVGLPAVALIWLRSDQECGLAAILYLFIVVWVTDIAAYASGRLIGGAKLAPRISPGKTWTGLVGGTAGAALSGAMFAQLVAGAGALRLGLMALLLSLLAQAGDLAESALKRRSGHKDASHLIPGHGGMLDRVDGLIVAAFAAALIGFLLAPGAPARALLVGQ